MDDRLRADLVRQVIERMPPRTGARGERREMFYRVPQVLYEILARCEPCGLGLTARDAGRVMDEVYLILRIC